MEIRFSPGVLSIDDCKTIARFIQFGEVEVKIVDGFIVMNNSIPEEKPVEEFDNPTKE